MRVIWEKLRSCGAPASGSGEYEEHGLFLFPNTDAGWLATVGPPTDSPRHAQLVHFLGAPGNTISLQAMSSSCAFALQAFYRSPESIEEVTQMLSARGAICTCRRAGTASTSWCSSWWARWCACASPSTWRCPCCPGQIFPRPTQQARVNRMAVARLSEQKGRARRPRSRMERRRRW